MLCKGVFHLITIILCRVAYSGTTHAACFADGETAATDGGNARGVDAAITDRSRHADRRTVSIWAVFGVYVCEDRVVVTMHCYVY